MKSMVIKVRVGKDTSKISKAVKYYESLALRLRRCNINQSAAALAYFFFLSTFPFLLFVNTIIASFNISAQSLYELLAPLMPRQSADIIVQYNNYIQESTGGTTAIFALMAALFSASGGVQTLIVQINAVYATENSRNRIKRSVIAIVFTIALGLLLLVSAVLTVAGERIQHDIAQRLGTNTQIVATIRAVLWCVIGAFGFFAVLLLYLIAPNTKTTVRSVLPGTVFVVAAFFVVSVGFSLYVDMFGKFSVLYGAIGAVLGLLVWLYLIGTIILVGAGMNCG